MNQEERETLHAGLGGSPSALEASVERIIAGRIAAFEPRVNAAESRATGIESAEELCPGCLDPASEHDDQGCHRFHIVDQTNEPCDCRLGPVQIEYRQRLFEQRGAERAWDECLATVTSGVASAKNAHAERGHRQIVSALVGLEQAIPRTENPYRGGGEK